MAQIAKFVTLRHRLLHLHRRLIPTELASRPYSSRNAETEPPPDFTGTNAYEILGVSPASSFAEIKASFRKLAKETHPDLAQSLNHSSYASDRFIQILAAYEILSDATRRAHYDHCISSQRIYADGNNKRDTKVFKYNSHRHPTNEMEVVEWLKWYRHTINDILSERRVTSGSGYFDLLERDFYAAVHAAFYGPEIDSMDLLPDRFEADERSACTTSEVLHLVTGRDLFGMVCLAKKYSELSDARTEKLASSALGSVQLADNVSADEEKDFQRQSVRADYQSSDAYKDLELHLSGRVVAMAMRVPPKSEDVDSEDQIHVYLTYSKDQFHARDPHPGYSHTDSSGGHKIPLGVIKGLGTTPEEGTCYLYDNGGMKTHMIMKHRTLLVKHLHWFRIGDEVSVCECRCSRARLPPSNYWLFEPRSAMHDIGGWYIETFGRDRKGKTVPDGRYWDGSDRNPQCEERLHPAVYLLGLAYRTLDIEDVRRRKRRLKDIVESEISRVATWFRKVA
ncbi:hypothetical protein SASPL_139663 [Salvia splendens]|uniref:J domain-containing protein n=1 Tax=Salvia splendens TaxID=180675 RepID=A0A8X8WQ47_SALSN|nr:uncharacterized protein LOC121768946 isoform X1 [Salvia splendens]KAG6398208.1 hypothetical protein SASPL_139663 [Salvia splendens]